MLTVGLKTNANLVAFEFEQAARDMRDKATASALNKMADQVKVRSAREIRAVGYSLRAATIKKGLTVRRANPRQLKAAVVAQGRPIPLIEFSARQTSKGVSVAVLNGRKVIPGAFIAVMPSGHRGVFVRQDGGRHKKVMTGGKASWHQLPIRELFGPSVPDGLANRQAQQILQDFITEKFPAILEHEHAWLARKLGRR